MAGAGDHYQAGKVFVSDVKPFKIKIISLGNDLTNSRADSMLSSFSEDLSDETLWILHQQMLIRK